jgi:L-alanine-DL-glutamate epimerase-like enolase superfamily enzyme
MLPIKKIELLRLSLPRKKAFELSRGTFEAANRLVVRVTLESGICGYGECATLEGRGARGAVGLYSEESEASCFAVLTTQVGPALLGIDALNMANVHRTMDAVTVMNPQAKAGVEMAIYDAVGKSLGVPAYVLLGGAYRKKIKLGKSVGVLTDQELIEGAQQVIDLGFHIIKLKGGRDVNTDVRRIELIRSKVSKDFPIRLDANAGYCSYDQVILPLIRAQAAGLDELEQPLGRYDIQGMRRLARDLHTPLIADESVFYASDVAAFIGAEAADVINIKVQKAGGMLPASRIDAVASASNVGVMIGAIQETGIGSAASLHLAAACKMADYVSDCGTYLHYEHTLLSSSLAIEDGCALVPEEPGLGIVVDVQALARYAQGDWVAIE